MRVVKTKTTYLEMHAPPAAEPAPLEDGVEIVQVESMDLEHYRQLHRSVGAAYNWIDRLQMSDQQLRPIIHNDRTDLYLLRVDGQTAGFAELDRKCEREIQLVYFGLIGQFIGRGLGKQFLDWVVRKAWTLGPDRVWLHTCDLDHPAALPNYLRAGFSVYQEKLVDQRVLEGAEPDPLRD